MNQNIPFWNCKLNAILIENKKIEIDDFIFFQSTHRTIFVPKYFIELLKQKIFNKYIKKGICSEIEIYNSISSFMIKCNCSAIENFPSLSFLVGNYKFDTGTYIELHVGDRNEAPYISVTKDFIPEKFIENITKKEIKEL